MLRLRPSSTCAPPPRVQRRPLTSTSRSQQLFHYASDRLLRPERSGHAPDVRSGPCGPRCRGLTPDLSQWERRDDLRRAEDALHGLGADEGTAPHRDERLCCPMTCAMLELTQRAADDHLGAVAVDPEEPGAHRDQPGLGARREHLALPLGLQRPCPRRLSAPPALTPAHSRTGRATPRTPRSTGPGPRRTGQ
jgi:hypothetical protein